MVLKESPSPRRSLAAGRTSEDEVQYGVGSEVVIGADAVALYSSIEEGIVMKICRQAALDGNSRWLREEDGCCET